MIRPHGAACIMVCPREPRQDLPDRQQLGAILAGRPFATAVRARRFLTHIVEETLAGRTDGIKELVLGIEVFDRPADFDPKTDTIVRVEAFGKVRAAHYLSVTQTPQTPRTVLVVPSGGRGPRGQVD